VSREIGAELKTMKGIRRIMTISSGRRGERNEN